MIFKSKPEVASQARLHNFKLIPALARELDGAEGIDISLIGEGVVEVKGLDSNPEKLEHLRKIIAEQLSVSIEYIDTI